MADIGMTGKDVTWRSIAKPCCDSVRSILFATTSAARLERPSLYKSSSASNWMRCLSGSGAEQSTIKSRALHLSMCLRNLWPSPLLAWAPSISPGISARMTLVKSSYCKLPMKGRSVVNGYGATSGWAPVIAPKRVLLPAFGLPTSPMSATTLSSSRNRTSSPFIPLCPSMCHWPGLEAVILFPRPPLPPLATTNVCPTSLKSPSNTSSFTGIASSNSSSSSSSFHFISSLFVLIDSGCCVERRPTMPLLLPNSLSSRPPPVS
mmetsp:Transcript_14870/g.28631  ORF Transcript_14870/g.28631 Transcript_14870/m.28631 type:complete len:263 (-) Transcript_14870:791-1579(-)